MFSLPIKVIVCGGRNFQDREYLYEILDTIHAEKEIGLLIEGGASGADTLAGDWAKERGVSLLVFPADWNRYGVKAGTIRNKKMLMEQPDLVIAFPGGSGTNNMIKITKEKGIEVLECNPYLC